MSTEQLTLNAKLREEIGTANSRRIRREGELPAILYGKKNKPLILKLDEVEVNKSARHGLHENSLIKIKIEADGKTKSKTVLVKDIQRHAISRKLIHIDFNEVALDEKIKAEVPLESVGEPKGVKEQGGVLEHILHELEIEALPADLPDKIEVDVTELMIGDSIHVGQITVSDKIKILNDPEVTVFAVAAPRVEEEPEPAPVEGEEAQEPELVDQKGKKEEEGEGEEGEKGEEKGKKEEKSEKE